MYYDAHNHLQDDWLAPHLDRIETALAALPLGCAVVNGTCEADWPRVAALARRYPWVRPSYGLHPWHAGNRSPDWFRTLKTFLDADPRAVVGEIGIDRWILDSARPDDPRLAGLRRAPLAEQGEVMLKQLALACDCEQNRPVTIHCLQAWGALEGVLRHVALPACGFLLHAYGGPAEMIKTFADRGAYFSFNGSFLDPRKERQRAVFKSVPFDRLLIETDAPAMPMPVLWRTHKLPHAADGTPVNHPANIEATYAGLAALLGIPLEKLAAQVRENFERLFG
ncbi:TatD family hydrolase [Geminisphaera colitermitum]|uniref:TatD family hydrolase n=1 Tax=Geminisphaera colitermitum TaxID=1148786 RepID=UPI000158CE15|nr:TatD family hydrolase [Geminisphaera colitermitum]